MKLGQVLLLVCALSAPLLPGLADTLGGKREATEHKESPCWPVGGSLVSSRSQQSQQQQEWEVGEER